MSLEDARKAAVGHAGIGFQMLGATGLVGIDLDNCLDPATGAMNEIATKLLAALPGTYCETTPSGKGLRLFASIPEGMEVPGFLNHAAGVECYTGKSARFLTVTGRCLPGREGRFSDITPDALALLEKYDTSRQKVGPATESAGAEVIRLTTAPAPLDPQRTADLDHLAAKDDSDLEFFTQGLPAGDRSERFYRATRRLLERGVAAAEILAWAWSRPGLRKYALSKRSFRERAALELLRADVERAVRNESPPLVADPVSAPDITTTTTVDDGGYEYGIRGRSRFVKRLATNVTRYLRVARPDLRFRYNERFGRVELNGKPFLTQGVAYNEIIRDMCRTFDWDAAPGVEVIASGIFAAAEHDTYDPVLAYLDTLAWDGADRTLRLLEAMGVEDSPLSRAIIEKVLIAAVARAREPGCKAEAVCVLVGEQGDRKSTIWRALAAAPEGNANPTAPSECFSDARILFTGGDKDSSMKSLGPWIHEVPELSTMKSADRDSVKAEISKQEEKYRPPYAREVVSRLRRGIRVGTTNDPTFLTDPTGARRYWLLHTTRLIDISWVMTNRDQLWAQADASYKQGKPWWFERGEHAEEMRERNEAAYDADGIEVALAERLTESTMSEWQKKGSVLMTEVAFALGIELARAPRNFPNRLGAALRRCGFVRTQARRDGEQTKAWKHKSWDAVPAPKAPLPSDPDLDALLA